ncbi:hypothetical protein EV644_113195 [Kribbella orskensis]|uniref:Uncharacterized protein n=1 Tax=Kribbella orskensis TaxID=2512216 RepID=A0ABY2BEQ2_9ACTN|nr:hypothetical protein EV642_114194 [Kribbella sp. VKM Ac-2500]TCO17965.1 hypothetical protein EV644_113195 [Kribbella orskensis]
MAFKLIESAQTRWRAVNAPHLVALVRAGAVFKNGKLIDDPTNQTEAQASFRMPEIAREMTRRWISEVPSKMV